MSTPTHHRVYALLVDADEDLAEAELADELAEAVPANGLRHIAAMALQKAGDLIVDPKTVLVWLLTTLGAPAVVIGLLVPVRESGSLLPQLALVHRVRRYARRKWVWVAGALGQALAVTAMAIVAITISGPVAGWSVLAALAVFACARALSSIASKDVLGRTIPRGSRGRVTGAATVVSGAVAVVIGVLLSTADAADAPAGMIALLLGIAALAWVAAAGVYAAIVERPRTEDADRRSEAMLGLLRQDPVFARYVIARTLLLVSALSPPFVVTLAADRQQSTSLAGLGPFVIGAGLASIVGGRIWGRLADRSSRDTIMWTCGGAAITVLGFVGLVQIDALRDTAVLYPATYLLLALLHTGVRIGRKTYLVDLAEGDERTRRVAVANAAMGVLLLLIGGISSSIAIAGPEAALIFLAAMGGAGVLVARGLPEVTAR